LRFVRGIFRIVVTGFIVNHDCLRLTITPVTTIRTMPLSNLKHS
jgi:hypothetical protein